LQTNNFDNTIGSYLQSNNFNDTISSYLQTNHINNTLTSYLQTNHINNALTSYLRTTLFVNSSERIVDTVSPQEIGGIKTFIASIEFRWGIAAINILPRNPSTGIASIRTYRYSDKASPSLGDSWEFGQGVLTDTSLAKSFVFACHGAGCQETDRSRYPPFISCDQRT
jgi:hypothetical protein